MTTAEKFLKTGAITVLVLVFLGACATTPQSNSTLSQAEQRIESLADNSRLNRLAASELREAQDQLLKAQEALADGAESAEVSHQARVAMTLADIALEAAKISDADSQVQRLRNERDQLRLEARAARAELRAFEERMRAEQADLARAQAEAARLAEAAERSQAELQRERALAQQREAELMRQQAEARQDQAERQARQAEEGRMLAEQRAAELERQTQQMREEADQLQQQLVDLQAQATDRGLVLTLGSDVLFDVNQDVVKEGAERTLDRIANFLNEYPERRVLIEGFTDSTGERDYNMALSMRRATSVRDQLTGRDVDPSRIQTRGYGPDYAVASNDSAAGRQLNRRVEVVISDDDQAVPDR